MMPLKSLLFAFSVLLVSACSNLKTVETKDANGKTTEKYTVLKNTRIQEGKYNSYYPNGQVMEESFYKNDSLQGERKGFYESGKVEFIENYDRGRFVGKYQKFYEAGQLSNEGEYVDNEMTGLWKRYYETGELREEVSFAKNAENGPFKEYHLNGKLSAAGAYLNGENENGELTKYDETGQPIEKMICDYGVCMTTWSQERGNVVVDTARLRMLADLRRNNGE